MPVPIAFVAKLLNTTIAKAHRKFKGGEIELEELIEWVEKRHNHPMYHARIQMIERLEKNLTRTTGKEAT